MDLTKNFPRSPRERLAGLAMLARTIDKARAALAGTLGEYIYDCPMDRQLFATLGTDAPRFAEAVRQAPDDAGVLTWARAHAKQPSPEEAAAHNQAIETWAPRSPEGLARFKEQRAKIAPDGPDIATWTDLIDAEEGRLPAAS